MIGLAGEVAAKKISSEEETYSDQSILIYHNNFLGIENAVAPFIPAVRAANATVADALENAFTAANASITAYVKPGAPTRPRCTRGTASPVFACCVTILQEQGLIHPQGSAVMSVTA